MQMFKACLKKPHWQLSTEQDTEVMDNNTGWFNGDACTCLETTKCLKNYHAIARDGLNKFHEQVNSGVFWSWTPNMPGIHILYCLYCVVHKNNKIHYLLN